MQVLSIVIDIAVIIANIVLIVALLCRKNNSRKQTKAIKEALKKFASNAK